MQGNNQNDRLNINGIGSRDHFQKHNERMAMFRMSHPVYKLVDSGSSKFYVSEITRPVYSADRAGRKGGRMRFTGVVDWFALIRLRRVTARRFSSN